MDLFLVLARFQIRRGQVSKMALLSDIVTIDLPNKPDDDVRYILWDVAEVANVKPESRWACDEVVNGEFTRRKQAATPEAALAEMRSTPYPKVTPRRPFHF